MKFEHGLTILQGKARPDSETLRSPEEVIAFVEERGLAPLFACPIEGISIEEHTLSADWWGEREERDPWEWRKAIAESGRVAYGRLLDGRMAYVSLRLFPLLASYRRDGYDFDTRIEEGIAPPRERAIMKELMQEDLSSYLIRRRAGFGKEGFKGYDGTLASLMSQTYVVIKNFRRKIRRDGAEYGWPVAVYTTPERRFGEELTRSAYLKSRERCLEELLGALAEAYPGLPAEAWQSLLKK